MLRFLQEIDMNRPDNYLAELPQPEPSPDLAVSIQARIAQIQPADRGRTANRNWTVWLMAAGGLSAALALAVSMALVKAPIVVTSIRPRGLFAGLGSIPSETLGATAFAAGLMFFVFGLFASTSERRGQ